jgi:hypothetical protein
VAEQAAATQPGVIWVIRQPTLPVADR